MGIRSTSHRSHGLLRSNPTTIEAYDNDPYWDNVGFYVRIGQTADGSTAIVDLKGNAITVGGSAQVDNAQQVVGDTNMILLGGSGAYFTLADAISNRIGTQDYTLEWFHRPNAQSDFQTFISKGYTGSGGFLAQSSANNTYKGTLYINGGAVVGETTAISAGTTYHRCIEGVRGVHTWYLNGAASSASVSNTNSINSTGDWVFGGGSATGINSFWVNGWYGLIRLTVGVARYKGAFTPPSIPFGSAGRLA